MADAIHGLINYQGLANMFARYGRWEVENLKWENAAFEVKKVYDSAMPYYF
jgi:glycogen synthase